MNAATVTELPGPGERLSQERNRRGWTVPDTAEKLHLEPRAVQAIEANEFEKLGPQVFAKGHLKQYALLLGLPTEEVLSAYERVLRTAMPAAPVAVEAPRTALPMSPRGPLAAASDASHTPFPSMAPVAMSAARWARLPRWALPAIVGVLVLLIIAGVLLWLKPWHRAQGIGNSQGAALPASLEQPAAPVAPEADQPAGMTSGSAAGAATSAAAPAAVSHAAAATSTGSALHALSSTATPASALAPASSGAGPAAASSTNPAGRLRLRLSFTSASWVEVRDASGAMVFRGKGAANSVKVVSGAAPLQVYLGAVSGVQLELNRHAVVIGPQFVHGDVARFEAGADGVLRRVPRP